MNTRDDFWQSFYSIHRSTFSRYFIPIFLSLLSLGSMKFIFLSCGGLPLTSLAILSVILSCIYGGKGPAMVSIVITAFGLEFVFIPSSNLFLHWGHSLIRVLTYITTAVIVGSLVESFKKNLITCQLQKDMVVDKIAEKEEILSVVSHDLRAPLSSVLLSASLLKRGTDHNALSDNASRLVLVILDSARRMNKLIEDLLDSVKIEAGNISLDIKPNNLVEIISSSVNDSLYTANQKVIEIVLHKPKEELEVMCDRDRLIQVISNIIGNSLKFSPEKSQIVIDLQKNSKEIMISIKDQGCGIAPEDMPKLFDKFWQVQDTAHLGTGLGLFIAHKIVKMHNGRIEVDSILEKGSTFKIYLPRV